jgi:hypothetical protein
MGMIGQEREGITGRSCIGKNGRTAVEKVFPVIVIEEYLFPFDTPNYDMVKYTGCIKPWLSWHRRTVTSRASACQDDSYLVMDVPLSHFSLPSAPRKPGTGTSTP